MNATLSYAIYPALLISSISSLAVGVLNAAEGRRNQARRALNNIKEICVKPHQEKLATLAFIRKERKSSGWGLTLAFLSTIAMVGTGNRFLQPYRSGNLLHPAPWYLSENFLEHLRSGAIFATGLLTGYYIRGYRDAHRNPIIQDETLKKIESFSLLLQEIEQRVGDRLDAVEQSTNNSLKSATNKILYHISAQAHTYHQMSDRDLTQELRSQIQTLPSDDRERQAIAQSSEELERLLIPISGNHKET